MTGVWTKFDSLFAAAASSGATSSSSICFNIDSSFSCTRFCLARPRESILSKLQSISQGELIVVDVKATSKQTEVNLDADWQISYKQQMEIYQWLLLKKGNITQ